MAAYSYSELVQMQNDALRRVREMQSRADLAAANANAELGLKKAGASGDISAPLRERTKREPMDNDYMEQLREYAKNAASSSHTQPAPAQQAAAPANASFIPAVGTLFEGAASSVIDTLAKLGVDSERALLIALILLLGEEECDRALLLALLYVMT